MKFRNHGLMRFALLLALTPSAFAMTWYVNGASGSDNNSCQSRQSACKTIGHAISLASAGDSIMVAAATYKENLSITDSLNFTGAGAATTIIDGSARGSVVTIASVTAHVTVSGVTLINGAGFQGGGIYNVGNANINS